MEGSKVRKLRKLRVERDFEGGRLEGQLLASAYEQAVPAVSVSVGMVADQREASQRGSALEIPVAKGA
jgi:hypothetical protein